MIFEHSRYATGTEIEPAAKPDGSVVQAIRIPLYYGTAFSARKHITREDERMEEIAAEYYRDPEMWWVIAIANPEILYPDQFEPGTVLRIPDVSPVR